MVLKRLELTEKMVYNFLEARFGEEERRSPKAAIGPRRMEDKETRTIRLSKREARRDKKEAKRSKDQNSIMAANMEYLKLVRLHNKSRRNQLRKQKKKENKKEQEQFKRNPFEYSKKLLDGKSNNKPPEFSKEATEKFFKNEYRDKERGAIYGKLSRLPDAHDPRKVFEMGELNWVEFKSKLKSRRNKSSPGPNGVPYLVYKRCPRVTLIIFRILSTLWEKKIVPLQWRIGEAILIPKTEDLSNPVHKITHN